MKSTDIRSSPRFLAVMAVAALSVTAGCSAADDLVSTAAAGAPARPTLVTPAEGRALVDEGAVLIDVRTPAEYGEVRIDGALLIDVSAAVFDTRIADLDPTVPYVVYCRSGNRSAVAVDRMAALGFTEIYDMGGIIDWAELGFPVVAG